METGWNPAASIPSIINPKPSPTSAQSTDYGSGLILLDKGDELFRWSNTVKALGDYFPLECFEGGSHRFDHMGDALVAYSGERDRSFRGS